MAVATAPSTTQQDSTFVRPAGLRHGEWARLRMLLECGAVIERRAGDRTVYERNPDVVSVRLVPIEA